MHFQLSSFFCWDLATGAKIIGATGLLKHSLAILVLYLDAIALWVTSNDKEYQISFSVYTLAATLLFIGFLINVLNLILSYKLFKISETNQLKDLTDWINAERIYLALFIIYFIVKIYYGEMDLKPILRIGYFCFDVYCYLCVMSLREDYRQRASLLGSQA